MVHGRRTRDKRLKLKDQRSHGIQGKALDSQEVGQAGQGVCVISVFEGLETLLDKALSWL